jgi:hypothetical protein
MILLLSLLGQFLVVQINEMDFGRITLNVPKELAMVALEYALENSNEKFRIGSKEFSIDSLLELLDNSKPSDEAILKIEGSEKIVKLWIKESDDIVKPQARPRKLVMELEEDENSVFLKLPLWMAERLPSFITVTGEDKYNVSQTKKLISSIISNIKETEGSFTLMEFDESDRKLKIFLE